MSDRYSIERLTNGYYRVDDRASELVGLYYSNGLHRSGDLSNVPYIVQAAIMHHADSNGGR